MVYGRYNYINSIHGVYKTTSCSPSFFLFVQQLSLVVRRFLGRRCLGRIGSQENGTWSHWSSPWISPRISPMDFPCHDGSGWCWFFYANMPGVYWWDPWHTIEKAAPLGSVMGWKIHGKIWSGFSMDFPGSCGAIRLKNCPFSINPLNGIMDTAWIILEFLLMSFPLLVWGGPQWFVCTVFLRLWIKTLWHSSRLMGFKGCASHDSTVPKGIDDSQLTLGRKMPNKRLPTSMGAIRTSTSRELVAVGRFHYPRGCRKSSIGGSGTFRTAESNSAEWHGATRWFRAKFRWQSGIDMPPWAVIQQFISMIWWCGLKSYEKS